MRKYTTGLLLVLFTFIGSGHVQAQEQTSPRIQVQNLRPNEKPIRISDVKIHVKVVGSLAVTTVDMTFHNPNNRVMEGDLEFPLGDGQSISRFALDINGKLREGVVVEKAKRQEVFESVIRRKVDPGLLEKTQGNNFRTRVYPLPARGTRRILIAYEQELPRVENAYRFFLPTEYRDKLDNFSVEVMVYGKEQEPTVEQTPWGNFAFDTSGEAYIASYKAKDYKATGQLVFSLPIKNDLTTYIEKGDISGNTFFYSQTFPELSEQKKQLPSHIALFWDTSSSMSNRDLKLEMELLQDYFSKLKNVKVDLYLFNFLLSKPQTFNIKNGDWSALQKELNTANYDGATQLRVLDFSKIQAEEILLFTDGLSNFGKQTPILGTTPVSVINARTKADFSMQKYIASTSSGAYINLLQVAPKEAVDLLLYENFKLISATYNASEISGFTSSGNIVNPKEGFSIAGKLKAETASITLNFGVGKRVLYTQTINLKANKAKDYGNIVERVWAEKKIAELDLLYKQNKEEIASLGRAFNIVTRNTSLIVLDSLEDYVQHEITPPAELLDEYNQRIAEQKSWKKKESEEQIASALSLLKARKSWWDRDFAKEIKELKEKDLRIDSLRSLPGDSSRIIRQTNTFNNQEVKGNVFNTEGYPLLGVTVIIKDTNISTNTDFDGGYTINAKEGGVLVFSYIGYESIEVVVSGSVLEVALKDLGELDPIVITTYCGPAMSKTALANRTVTETSTAEEISESVAVYETEEDSSVERDAPQIASKIVLQTWTANAPYLEELKSKTDKDIYASYLAIKGAYKDTPSFFLDVSMLFEERGLKEEALLILSNLAELEIENYRLTRVLAHRLKQLGYIDYAIEQFELLLELRPEEPQTYRDLGLAYAQNKAYQKAIETLYVVIERKWDARFYEIELVVIEEINTIIQKAEKEKVALLLYTIDNRFIYNMPVDIRIVLNWDTDNSDMDLWVTDPSGEITYYANRFSKSGGLLTRDFTGGYGPEAFLIKNALKGTYKIKANYFGSSQQTWIGPTTIYLDIYTKYASGQEKKETITMRLESSKDTIEVGEIVF